MPVVVENTETGRRTAEREDVVSNLAACAKAVFEEESGADTESLQNLIDSLSAKVVGVAFEVFREEYDDLVRLLRNGYGQLARFAKGDFRKDACFYLGQLHALTEVTYRMGHQRVPREAMALAVRSRAARDILLKTAQEKSISAGALAKELKLKESNLSAACKPLVQKELLRRDRFGRRVRYSATPLTFAVAAELSRKADDKADSSEDQPKGPSFTGMKVGAPNQEATLLATTAAAVSLKSGSGTGANAGGFVKGLFTCPAAKDGKGIPSGRYVLLEAMGSQEHPESSLPTSLSKPLNENLQGWSSIEWNGEELVVAPGGTSFELQFVKNPDPQKSKSQVREEIQKIRETKKCFEELEKIYTKALNTPKEHI